MICVFQTIKTFVGDSNQLVGLFAILRERGDSLVHAYVDAKRQSLQRFRKNGFDTPAEAECLLGVGLGQQHREFVATEPFADPPANLVCLERTELDYTLLLRACDVVVTKPGFKPLQFLIRRAFRLYPLWIVTSIAMAYLFKRYLGWPPNATIGFVAYSFTLLPTDGYPFYDLGWTLQHELAFYVLAALIAPRFGLVGLMTFLWVGFIMDHLVTLPWYLHQYAFYYPNFLAGVGAFLVYPHLKRLGFLAPRSNRVHGRSRLSNDALSGRNRPRYRQNDPSASERRQRRHRTE